MRYLLLGSSALRVSEVALGTMTFGEDWGWGATEDECRRMFEEFASRGGNFIDTACNYTNGSSERIVGKCLASDRDRFVVASKYTLTTDPSDPNAGGNHRKNLMLSLERSLERLTTDYLDVLYLHMWDYLTPLEEVMRALDDVVRAGKVLHVAFSDTPAWVVSRAVEIAHHHGWARPTAIQVPYSLATRDPEREILPMAEDSGLGFVAWGVLEEGLLSGKHLGSDLGPSRLAASSLSEEQLDLARGVHEIAKEIGAGSAQVAVNWVRANPWKVPTIPILGARSVVQLGEQLDAIDTDLTDEVYMTLNDLMPFDVGFPRSFLESDHVRGLIGGDTRDRVVT
jgi:aryl-alcohol dehydrogenase-like predicted oxidoreductase